MHHPPPPTVTANTLCALLLCRVIDNYGDAAIAARLAHTLAAKGTKVFLYIDAPQTLAALHPKGLANTIHVISLPASGNMPPPPPVSGDVLLLDVLEGSAPLPWVATVAQHSKRFFWCHYHYLTAEPWSLSCHLQPAPLSYQGLPLQRLSFFPGFAQNGGLPASMATPAPTTSLPPIEALHISLFLYPQAPFEALFAAWYESVNNGGTPICCHLPTGLVTPQQRQRFHHPDLLWHEQGFIPQAEYDTLLQRCDWNFVRGEDSFAQAALAGKPHVWMAYPQTNLAHHAKVQAYLERLNDCGVPPAAQGLTKLCNGIATTDQDCGNTKDWQQAWQEAVSNPHTPQAFATFSAQLHAHGEAVCHLLQSLQG